eukprot:3564345-Rhodomonas_salina.1
MNIRKASPKAVLLAMEHLETSVAERVRSVQRGNDKPASNAEQGAYTNFVALLADKQLGSATETPVPEDDADVHTAHCTAAPGACGGCASPVKEGAAPKASDAPATA